MTIDRLNYFVATGLSSAMGLCVLLADLVPCMESMERLVVSFIIVGLLLFVHTKEAGR